MINAKLRAHTDDGERNASVIKDLMDRIEALERFVGSPNTVVDWITLSVFSNGWVTAIPVKYRKVNDKVELVGAVSGGTSGTSPFTFPPGNCPGQQVDFAATAGGNSHGVLTIATSGIVTLTGNNAFFSLCIPSFSVTP